MKRCMFCWPESTWCFQCVSCGAEGDDRVNTCSRLESVVLQKPSWGIIAAICNSNFTQVKCFFQWATHRAVKCFQCCCLLNHFKIVCCSTISVLMWMSSGLWTMCTRKNLMCLFCKKTNNNFTSICASKTLTSLLFYVIVLLLFYWKFCPKCLQFPSCSKSKS